MVSALQRAGGVMDSGADPDISGAAADVAVHGEIDVAVGRLLDLAQQSDGAHDLTRLAVAALRSAATGSEQDRNGFPSRKTVHAPHWAIPQPNLVPIRPSVSRSTHSSGVLGS